MTFADPSGALREPTREADRSLATNRLMTRPRWISIWCSTLPWARA